MSTKKYELAGRAFTQEPLVFGQWQWVKALLKKRGDLQSLTGAQVMDLITDDAPALLAIILIPEGMTRAEKIKQGMGAVSELEQWIKESVEFAEVATVASDFFQLNNLGVLMGKFARPVAPETPGNGSMSPSSSSPMEILPSATTSYAT